MGQKIVLKFNAQSAMDSEDVGWMFIFLILGSMLQFELGSV